MHITLIPQRCDDALAVTKQGDTLTVNGTAYDFSVIPDGASLPASATNCPFFVGSIDRVAGVLRLTLLLPHGANPPTATAFPVPIVNPPNGALALPAYDLSPPPVAPPLKAVA